MIKEKIHTIFEEIRQLSSEQQRLWFTKILQEVAVYYQAFSEENLFGDPTFFDRVVYLVKKPTPTPTAIQTLRQELEREGMIPDTEEYGTLSASLCINSCVIADYILQFLDTQKSEILEKIIESHFEIAEMLYGKDLEENLRPVAWESLLCAQPDFKHFIQKQEERIQAIR